MSDRKAEARSGGTGRQARTVLGFAAAIVVIAGLVWFGQRKTEEGSVRIIPVYAFSALQGVLEEAILPAFAESWRQRTGERVEFATTFAGSGLLVERLVREIPADVAILASRLDVRRLGQKGVYVTGGPRGEKFPHDGVPFRSPIVLGVADGNPLGVARLGDLRHLDGRIIHCDPLTSGAGEWSLLACYGAARQVDGDAEDAARALVETWRQVPSTFPSARQASRALEEGQGDVLLTYEAEILRLQAAGAAIAIVQPPVTVLCEPVVVKLSRNVPAKDAELVDALIAFLWEAPAQRIFAEHGFRPVEEPTGGADFPDIDHALTLPDFGGVEGAERDVILGIWKERIAGR